MSTSNKTASKSNGGAATAATVATVASSSSPPSPHVDSSYSPQDVLGGLVYYSLVGAAVYYIGSCAYRIRMLAIEEYGPVIHEFDPYFNWRATEYLYFNGWAKFVKWFDYKVWYPLGRPVGTTIYPGMQVTAVFLKNRILKDRMSLNDICCYMPAWFGVSSSVLTGLIAYECSLPGNCRENIISAFMNIFRTNKQKGSVVKSSGAAVEVGVCAMAIMAIVPAHLMRSVGGGYDNESVAVTAMTLTFYLWCRSLRTDDSRSYWFGALAGIAYFNMVASWGGYVFVINMIGAHAMALVLFGRFCDKVYMSYTLFYLIGTALATRVPVVGWAPLKNLEQLAPCAVFLGYQALQLSEVISRSKGYTRLSQIWRIRFQVFALTGCVAVAVIFFVAPTGYFGPLSARVRGLFVKHTRTGNPLVDSVAEHQPANQKAYFQYLHYLEPVAPVGFLFVLFHFGDASSFLLLYAAFSYFFSAKMVRLILLLAPIASVLGGVVIGRILLWSYHILVPTILGTPVVVVTAATPTTHPTPSEKKKDSTKKNKRNQAMVDATAVDSSSANTLSNAIIMANNTQVVRVSKNLLSVFFIVATILLARMFKDYCWMMGGALSNPSIIQKAKTNTGEVVIVDDYREAYFWLGDNTPKDSRILAWWDYGYQITGIANRTTLADGNTWNHEHIALLGRILTGSEEEGYDMARHLADYALVWAGGGGDDLAKSPHLARIANSVFRNMCPGDPTCRSFGFMDKHGTPSNKMAKSFLYKLHSHRLKPGVEADPTKFREVYRTKYGKVRIYKILGVSKESKAWVAKNRKCDAPGSWFCPGQYPPALEPYLKEKKDFSQLEDFNKKTTDDDYQKAYMENLADPSKVKKGIQAEAVKKKNKQTKQETVKKSKDKIKQQQQRVDEEEDDSEDDSDDNNAPQAVSETELINLFHKWKASDEIEDQIDDSYATYRDTEEATLMWKVVTTNAKQDLIQWLAQNPIAAYVRSSDGRGPMWWAYETNNMAIADLLKQLGLSDRDRDKNGKRPIDLLKQQNKKKGS